MCGELEVDKTSTHCEAGWEGTAIQGRKGQGRNKGGGGGKTAVCVAEWDSEGTAVAHGALKGRDLRGQHGFGDHLPMHTGAVDTVRWEIGKNAKNGKRGWPPWICGNGNMEGTDGRKGDLKGN